VTKNLKFGLTAIILSCTVDVSAAAELVRLIDTSGIPPNVTPVRITTSPGFHSNVADVFQWLQPIMVDWAISNEQSRLIADARQEAIRTGQRGILLKVRISTASFGDRSFFYPVGSGVSVVGVGPSTDAICYAEQCFNVIETPPDKGTTLDYSKSSYVWVEATDGTKQWHYPIPAVNRRAQAARLYNNAQSAYAQTVSGQYLSGFANHLTTKIATEDGRNQVRSLLQRSEEATKQLARVENDLAENLAKAKRAANANSVFDTLSGVFSMAANVALFSSMVGTDLKTLEGKSPSTKADLLSSIKAVETGSEATAKVLQEQKIDLLKRYDSSRQEIIQLGSDNGMGGNFGILFHLK